jgi:hypothetical protein
MSGVELWGLRSLSFGRASGGFRTRPVRSGGLASEGWSRVLGALP